MVQPHGAARLASTTTGSSGLAATPLALESLAPLCASYSLSFGDAPQRLASLLQAVCTPFKVPPHALWP